MRSKKGKKILALCLALALASGPAMTGAAEPAPEEAGIAQNEPVTEGGESRPEGGEDVPDASAASPEGGTVPDGSIKSPESGSESDGSVTSPDSGIVPDGSETSPESGSESDGSITSPEGGNASDGSVMSPEGGNASDGSVTSPEGGNASDGSVTSPDSGNASDSSVTSPDSGSASDSSVTSPEGGNASDGSVMSPDGGVASDGSVTSPEGGAVQDGNGMLPGDGATSLEAEAVLEKSRAMESENLPENVGTGLEIDLSVYENGPKEPLPAPDEGIAAMALFGDEPDQPETYALGGAKFNDPSSEFVASVEEFEISIESKASTVFAAADWNYSASIPEVISFFDYQGRYNVAYQDAAHRYLVIQRYNARMNLNDTLRIASRYPLFGTVVADEYGHYYVVEGQNDLYNQNSVTVCVSKYDYKGNLLGECALKGYDMDSYSSSAWGTAQPFRSGNCVAVVNQGILACNFSRQMYNGHQSNYVFFVNCSNMQRTRTAGIVPYCSHSFDQRIIPLSGVDGGDYLVANQGDAFPRSFRVSVVKMQEYGQVYDIDNFHFREGAERSYGYNETYAQMGGIGETRNAYVFCGSSERTLSLAPAPTGGEYCGHSEARDLFVQFLKKDFYKYQGSEQYVTRENVRYPQGQRPGSSQLDFFYLNGSERDYGVIWLTEYEDDYYVNNPKMIVTDDNRIVVMWEKLSYASHTGTSYYAILNEDGSVYRHPLEIVGAGLAGNVEPVYRDGKIYWTTSDETGAHVYSLDLSQTEKRDSYVGLRKVGDKWIFVRSGKKDSSVNGLVPYEGQWFYLRNGEVDTSVRGFVDYDGKKFYLTEGRVCSEYSGLVQDPDSGKWFFIAQGQFQDQYTGLALYDGSWFLLSSGVLNDSYNGLYRYDGRDFLMANGQIRTDYSGLFEYNGSWYFLVSGQVSDYTGLVLYDEHWFYIRNGILASYYTGNVTYDGKTFYVSNGQIY